MTDNKLGDHPDDDRVVGSRLIQTEHPSGTAWTVEVLTEDEAHGNSLLSVVTRWVRRRDKTLDELENFLESYLADQRANPLAGEDD